MYENQSLLPFANVTAPPGTPEAQEGMRCLCQWDGGQRGTGIKRILARATLRDLVGMFCSNEAKLLTQPSYSLSDAPPTPVAAVACRLNVAMHSPLHLV